MLSTTVDLVRHTGSVVRHSGSDVRTTAPRVAPTVPRSPQWSEGLYDVTDVVASHRPVWRRPECWGGSSGSFSARHRPRSQSVVHDQSSGTAPTLRATMAPMDETTTSKPDSVKDELHRKLQLSRAAVLSKLEGLS